MELTDLPLLTWMFLKLPFVVYTVLVTAYNGRRLIIYNAPYEGSLDWQFISDKEQAISTNDEPHKRILVFI